MVSLTNPLTTKERLALTRVLDHDMTNILNNIYGAADRTSVPDESAIRRIRANLDSFGSFYKMLRKLTQSGEISINKNCNQSYTPDFMNHIYESLSRLGSSCLELRTTYSKMPIREEELTYTVLHNLAKNSVNARAKLIQVTIEPSSFPKTATFIPKGARNYKDFIAFRVSDNGRGFPQGEDPSKRFTICPPNEEHGFGLYFTGLVAKVLRAPVEIQSVPGDTTVSFYHPVFEND